MEISLKNLKIILSAAMIIFMIRAEFSYAQESTAGRNLITHSDKLASFINDNLSEIQMSCKGKRDELINVRKIVILCYHGVIEKPANSQENNRKFSIVYLNSPGGDISYSFVLGREIFRNGAYGIIDQQCHSACGSYLLPSPKRIFIADNTAMSIHTASPRTAKDFILMRYSKSFNIESADGKNPRDSHLILNSIEDLMGQYDKFYQEFVLGEMNYFNYIARDVAFAQRYREVYRTLSRRSRYACGPQSGLHLIIGPEYLAEFDIKVIRPWFPSNRADFVALLPNASKTDALIYDFDDHPFWIPGKGMVSPSYCLEE